MSNDLKLWVLISKTTGQPVVFDKFETMEYNPHYSDTKSLDMRFINAQINTPNFRGNEVKGHELVMASIRPRMQQGEYAKIFDSLDELVQLRNDLGLQGNAVPKRLRTIEDVVKYNPVGLWYVWFKQDVEHARKRLGNRLRGKTIQTMRKNARYNALGFKGN